MTFLRSPPMRFSTISKSLNHNKKNPRSWIFILRLQQKSPIATFLAAKSLQKTFKNKNGIISAVLRLPHKAPRVRVWLQLQLPVLLRRVQGRPGVGAPLPNVRVEDLHRRHDLELRARRGHLLRGGNKYGGLYHGGETSRRSGPAPPNPSVQRSQIHVNVGLNQRGLSSPLFLWVAQRATAK